MDNIINFQKATTEKGGIHMCVPTNKIYGKKAIDILREFGNPSDVPVNLENILKTIGISALPMDFEILEGKLNKGHILGLVLANKHNAVIYYSQDATPNRQRFTIAHELGHICNHLQPDTNDYPYIDWRIEEESNNKNEIDASIFAGELLIPLEALKNIYLSMAYKNSVDLARIFGTSINVMEERLNYLKVSYYNHRGQAIIYE